ncbi:hypothetical protein PVAP13_7NG444700 [Panicum virgatum]|uniref:MBD domain-containing protein n=1 Tax=Panicum virgatum TaxID=38727 RepID=A0A8T0Q8Z0_PANVG|nr:hypothetical protein PVAP13_7NG444700 [Panicum virgatum]
MSRPSSPILISDDEKGPAAAPVAAVPGAKDDQTPVAAAAEQGWSNDDGDEIETPDWLPDGFEMEGYYERDGTFKTTAYICPVSGLKFKMMEEVLDYCFSDGIERAIAGKETLQDKTTLQGKYAWLRQKHGWVLEIRAGGENFSKMFKFYAHLSAGVRLASKHEVLNYIDEAELPQYVNEDCDTSSEDNIIAQLDFNINSLPPGWVKETTFRKCSDDIRKDTFYTDPVTKKVFRSLKSAEQYVISGEPMDAHVPIMSVTDMYYFDRCTDMLPCLARRLKMEGTRDQKCEEEEGQTSHRDAKGMLYGDVNKEHDEEEWHGDDESDEVHDGDGKEEEDNEDALYGDGAEEEDEQEATRGDNNENNEERQGTDRYRSITELYEVTTQVTGCSLTSSEE